MSGFTIPNPSETGHRESIMGKHEAKGRASRKVQFGQKVIVYSKHIVIHVSGLITLHTIASLILTKSPIALLLH